MIIAITTRQLEIIEAAGKILSIAGVSGLTIKNLSKEMKFSESAIYRHFASKEEIIISMLNYLSENMDERLTNVVSKNQPPEEQFTTIFHNQISFFKNNPHFVVAVFSDGLMEESLRINEAISKIMGVKLKHLMPVITKGQEKGVFTNVISTHDLIHIVMGSFRLQMFKWRAANFKFDLQQNGGNIIKALLILITTKNK